MYIMLNQVNPGIIIPIIMEPSIVLSSLLDNVISFLKFLYPILAKRLFAFYPVFYNLSVIYIFFSFKAP
jgi:hypothetical protein